MRQRGQGALEYVYLIGIVAVAIFATTVYMKRGFQGNLRSQSEQIGAGAYAPGNTTANNLEIKRGSSKVVSTSTTTTTYGNTQSETPEITQKKAEIKALNEQLTTLISQRDAALIAGNKILAEALDLQIKSTQDVLKQAQKDLKDLIDAYAGRGVIADQIHTTSSNIETGKESVQRQVMERLGGLSDDGTTGIDTGIIGQAPVTQPSGPFLNAQTLELGAGQPWPGMLFQSGERKYFKFTIPPGMEYFSASIASYDQTQVMNMVVVKGDPPADVFDQVYQNNVANGWPISGYANSTTINGTQVWDRMTNNPYGQDLFVFNPQPGTYYMIVQTADTGSNHLNVAVGGK